MVADIIPGKIFIGGLKHEIDERKLEGALAKYGRITDVMVIRDKMTNSSKGFGFVTFENPLDAEDAKRGMDGKDLFGQEIHIELAREKEPRSFPPRGSGASRGGYREDFGRGSRSSRGSSYRDGPRTRNEYETGRRDGPSPRGSRGHPRGSREYPGSSSRGVREDFAASRVTYDDRARESYPPRQSYEYSQPSRREYPPVVREYDLPPSREYAAPSRERYAMAAASRDYAASGRYATPSTGREYSATVSRGYPPERTEREAAPVYAYRDTSIRDPYSAAPIRSVDYGVTSRSMPPSRSAYAEIDYIPRAAPSYDRREERMPMKRLSSPPRERAPYKRVRASSPYGGGMQPPMMRSRSPSGRGRPRGSSGMGRGGGRGGGYRGR